jgi:serine phosphatase RsbU (regulator of sigma subunit)/streptogramin lyase
VSKYDGKTFTNFTTSQGLVNNAVRSITEDKTGSLWFGTDGGGVSRYDGIPFGNFTTAHGLSNNTVRCITEDKNGNLWFGTYGGGVSKYDGRSFTNFSIAQGLANGVVWCIIEDKNGNFWFGTDGGGVSKYNGKSFANFTTTHGLANNNVLSIAEDKNGNLWFGTYGGGVSKYDGKTFTNFTTVQGLANNTVWSIAVDKKGNLWFGTYGGGVSKYDGKNFTNFTTTQGLANNTVWSITEDKTGKLWFGTENGLSLVDEFIQPTKKNQTKDKKSNKETAGIKIKNYTIANGLPDNFITQVLQLHNGKIAVGTNFGIIEFNPELPLDVNGQLVELEIFNGSTGYPIKDVNVGQNAMYQDSKGIIWAGTGEEKISLVRFDYNAVNHNLNAPNVVIQNLKLDEQNICYYTLDAKPDTGAIAQQEILTYNRTLTLKERDSINVFFKGIAFDSISRFYPIPQNLILPYKHNNITIEYNCVEVSNHFMVNYQYMLEGYDNDWSPVLKKQEAHYGNIDEGTYTFKLKAQSPDGIWCEPLTYKFTVLPPWYRTWWMYTFYIICAVGLIILIVRWNGRKLRARAKELKQKVEEATFEIKEQKHLIEEKHKEITDSINYAERIQKSFLATKELLDENLKDHFVFFQPKDVVSGDFYWASKLNNYTFALVTADSTGHGVPGAIMSLLNITSLESAIKDGLTQPVDILNATRKTIIERLKKDGSSEGGKDGMDCSLICFDFKNNKFTYSAANNPVWVVRKKEIIELNPDKMPVGKHDRDYVSFTQYDFELQKGDVVYALTDGLPDQFGGPKGKKFMYKQLKDLLINISALPMRDQKESLKTTLNNWKGDLEQIDDVCLIGVRV